MNKSYISFAVIAVVIGGISFFGGMKYQENKRPVFNRQFGNGQRTGGQGQIQGGNRIGLRPVSGEIIGNDDKSITVKLSDGSSKIIILSDSTQINKADQVTREDLKNGEKVAVFGQENTDGSITAQTISLNPAFGNELNRQEGQGQTITPTP